MAGKLKPNVLRKYVLSRVGKRDPSVIIGPSLGEDSAIIDLSNDKVLVAHVDPITGAVEHLGWLAVHVACNDVAVSGARPRWLLPVLYLPEECDEETIDKITLQIDVAAREVGAMIVGGHSEYTAGLRRPMISMTALGLARKDSYVSSGGARSGDLVLMTKTAAIEGTAVLASDFKDELLSKGIPEDLIKRGEGFIKKVSVVREALILAGKVTSMHDPTEGGIIGGVTEIAYASNTSIDIWEDRVPVANETKAFFRALGLDWLKALSSGVLLATVPKGKVHEALSILRKGGLEAAIIGEVKGYGGYLAKVHRSSGDEEIYDEVYVEDEVIKLWEVCPG